MRTPEQIRQDYHKVVTAYYYRYRGDLRQEITYLARDLAEAREIALDRVLKVAYSFEDTLRISTIQIDGVCHPYKEVQS